MNAKRLITTGALTILMLAGTAAAQTTTPTSSVDVTPGTPNTGSGGNAAMNILLLTGSAAVGIGGLAMLSRRREI